MTGFLGVGLLVLNMIRGPMSDGLEGKIIPSNSGSDQEFGERMESQTVAIPLSQDTLRVTRYPFSPEQITEDFSSTVFDNMKVYEIGNEYESKDKYLMNQQIRYTPDGTKALISKNSRVGKYPNDKPLNEIFLLDLENERLLRLFSNDEYGSMDTGVGDDHHFAFRSRVRNRMYVYDDDAGLMYDISVSDPIADKLDLSLWYDADGSGIFNPALQVVDGKLVFSYNTGTKAEQHADFYQVNLEKMFNGSPDALVIIDENDRWNNPQFQVGSSSSDPDGTLRIAYKKTNKDGGQDNLVMLKTRKSDVLQRHVFPFPNRIWEIDMSPDARYLSLVFPLLQSQDKLAYWENKRMLLDLENISTVEWPLDFLPSMGNRHSSIYLSLGNENALIVTDLGRVDGFNRETTYIMRLTSDGWQVQQLWNYSMNNKPMQMKDTTGVLIPSNDGIIMDPQVLFDGKYLWVAYELKNAIYFERKDIIKPK